MMINPQSILLTSSIIIHFSFSQITWPRTLPAQPDPQLSRIPGTAGHVVFGSPLRPGTHTDRETSSNTPRTTPNQSPTFPNTQIGNVRLNITPQVTNSEINRQIRQKPVTNGRDSLNSQIQQRLSESLSLSNSQKEDIQAARKRAFIKRLDSNVENFMRKYSIEGLSLAIAVPKGVRVERAYGWSNAERRERMSPHHMLRLASLTKPITSAAVLKLVELGRLKLDDFVFGPNGVLGNRYGHPPFGYFVRRVTVRHLLEHSAGWPSNPASGDPVAQHSELGRTALISWVVDNFPLTKAPGTVFQYSNFGYLLLGRVIEIRSGQLYEQFVREQVLNRCGAGDMTNSQFWPGRQPMYYSNEDSPYTFPLTRADSALGWVSTAADYLRFVLCVDGWPQSADLLTSNSIQQMITPSKVHNAYGLGWSFNEEHDWWHSGSMPGCAAYVEKYRTGLAWVVLTNRRHEMRFRNGTTAMQHSLLQFESDLSHVISKQLF